MKKIYIYVTLFVLLFSGMVGCGDNTDTWGEHVLTMEELDELERQKRIADSLRNVINADLILEYTTEIIILNSGYDGNLVYIDTVQIAEFFGITPTKLAQGIQNMRTDSPYPDAPDITGFCIEWTTRNDNMTAYNTNACWGHWWDIDGNTTAWGDNAKVFAEYDPQGGYFNVGQMSGGLLREVLEKDNEDERFIKFIECLKYGDKRIAIVIKVIPKERGAVEGGVVNTQELSIEISPRGSYDTDPLGFDVAQTLADLGISSLDEAATLAVNADGSYAQETNAGNKGFWYDMDGFAGQWGDNASVYTSLDTDDEGNTTIGIGQYPDRLSVGEKYVIQYGFLAGNKIEMLKITISVVPPKDIVATVVNTQNISCNVEPRSGYDVDLFTFDVNRTLTDLGISNLSEAQTIALKEDGSYDTEAIAGNKGFWYSENGFAGKWVSGAKSLYTSLETDENGDTYLGIGQMPGTLEPGEVYVIHYGFMANDKIEMLKITVTIGEATEVVGGIVNTMNLNISMTPDNSFTAFPLTFDMNQIFTDLGISSMSEAKVVTVLEDGSIDNAYSANNGFWYALDGSKGSYGENASIYVEYGALEENQLAVGQMPNNMSVGDEVTVVFGFMANNKVVVLNIHAVISEYEDPETPPAGDPEGFEKDLTFTKPYQDEYQIVSEDVEDLLKNAFKMTRYQMAQALENGDLRVYVNEETEGVPAYTGSGAGEYWLNTEGTPVNWGEGSVIYFGLFADKDATSIYTGNHPSDCPTEGASVSFKIIITCKGVKAVFNTTVNITAAE